MKKKRKLYKGIQNACRDSEYQWPWFGCVKRDLVEVNTEAVGCWCFFIFIQVLCDLFLDELGSKTWAGCLDEARLEELRKQRWNQKADGDELAVDDGGNGGIDCEVALLREHLIDDVNHTVEAVDVRANDLRLFAFPLDEDFLGCYVKIKVKVKCSNFGLVQAYFRG